MSRECRMSFFVARPALISRLELTHSLTNALPVFASLEEEAEAKLDHAREVGLLGDSTERSMTHGRIRSVE